MVCVPAWFLWLLCAFTSQVRAARPAGPIVTLRFSGLTVCLFVHLSQSGEAWERINGDSWHIHVHCMVVSS